MKAGLLPFKLDIAAIVLFGASASLFIATVLEAGILDPVREREIYSYRGRDYPQEWDIPPLQRAQISMENSVHYAYNTTLSDKEWESTLPSGGGILYLGDSHEPYSISMFHQLRCLNIVRKGLLKFEGGGRTEEPDILVHHCMNYLRQMVMCRSDIEIEHARHLARGISVSEITHSTCRDWTAVYDAAEENHRRYLQSR